MEGLLSAFASGEWDSSNINLNDDAGLMLHQLPDDEIGEGSNSAAPAMWSSVADQSFSHPMRSFYTDLGHLSPQYGFSSSPLESEVYPSSCHEKYYIAESDNIPQLNSIGDPSEFCTMDVYFPYLSNVAAEDGFFIGGLELGHIKPDIIISDPNTQVNLKRKLVQSGQHPTTSEVHTKKSRAMKYTSGSKMVPSKKNRKTSLSGSDDEPINYCKQVSGSYSSENDSISLQELNAGTSSDSKPVPLHEKKAGQRGSAIDPQSLYARKRRDRINERLRILQNLVPNGTKVDISTMLEEAVSYVKFLQTQIKLLSSDDMWMYAPIAYNGVDIGLDRNLSQKFA